MSKYVFNEEEDLGKVVEQAKPFCSLSPRVPVAGIQQVTGDLAGHKFSKLCGFMFKSAAPSQYQWFMVVFCPKLRGNFVRNDRGLSGWYCWKHIGFQDEMVMSRKDMLDVFGFSVDKFFESDLFEETLPKFQSQVQRALGTTVKSFVEKLDGSKQREVQFYLNSVKQSLGVMGDVVKDAGDGSEKAKLAYNADANYKLQLEDAVHGYPKYEFNEIGDFETFFNALYHEEDLDKREHIVFRDESGREMKIRSWELLNNGVNFHLEH